MKGLLLSLAVLAWSGASLRAGYSLDWFAAATAEERKNIDPSAPCELGPGFVGTLLHCAAIVSADPQVVQDLIDAGVDVNAREPQSGLTALHLAVAYNVNPDVIDLLFEAGAEVLTGITVVDQQTGRLATSAANPHRELLGLASQNPNPAVLERVLSRICRMEGVVLEECAP